MPIAQPLLEKNLDHSSPDIREASANAKAKLLDGAGDLVDPNKRVKALVEVVVAGVSKLTAGSSVPKGVVDYLGDTCAAMLEEKLGGVVRASLFSEAVGECTAWITSQLSGIMGTVDAAGFIRLTRR